MLRRSGVTATRHARGGWTSNLALAAALILGVVVLTPAAERLRIPLPVLLTLYGLALPLLPATPELRIEPDLILPVVLPPLLFAATQRATARGFRDQARPILLLAVGLTVASAAAAAWVAHAAGLGWARRGSWAPSSHPDPWPPPPSPGGCGLPNRLVTVLEGEGTQRRHRSGPLRRRRRPPS